MEHISPHILMPKRGFPLTSLLWELIRVVLYKLKGGCQWHLLPVDQLFSGEPLHYKTVFGHYRRWCQQGVWWDCWLSLLRENRVNLDLSSVDIDDSHTPTVKGGEAVAYQGRKKRKTSNTLYFTNSQGLPLAMSKPVAGNHNDLHDIEMHAFAILEDARIATDRLFVNADAGFDAQSFRKTCHKRNIVLNVAHNLQNKDLDRDDYFDPLLYQERCMIESTNARMESFTSLLVRFDTKTSSWKGIILLAFIVIAIKKFKKIKKSK